MPFLAPWLTLLTAIKGATFRRCLLSRLVMLVVYQGQDVLHGDLTAAAGEGIGCYGLMVEKAILTDAKLIFTGCDAVLERLLV